VIWASIRSVEALPRVHVDFNFWGVLDAPRGHAATSPAFRSADLAGGARATPAAHGFEGRVRAASPACALGVVP
jgi:hypothetical protein